MFEIVDIRQCNVRGFTPLLEAESRVWRERLHWDFAPSAQLIATCLREKRISGYALVSQGSIKGYCFFFCDGDKGLIGNLFTEPAGTDSDQALALLERTIESLITGQGVRRVEAQLPHFPFEQLDSCFQAYCFEGYRRRFMSASLKKLSRQQPPGSGPLGRGQSGLGISEDFLIQRWDRNYDRAAAELLYSAYANHIDSAINDQYISLEGTTRLLENIVHHRGCGEYLPRASIVALHRSTQKLAAVLAFTAIQPSRTAHIPQIAVAKEFQGAGLGRTMLELSLAERAAEGYEEVSLTVTDLNAGAVRLYDRLGFETLHTFGAFVWNRQPKL